jgi:outer membrane protein
MRSLLLLISAVSLAAQTPPPVNLTLPEAEALAVRNNPNVSAALLNSAAANQVTLEVRSAFLPTITGNLTGVGALDKSALSAGSLSNSSVYDRLSGGIAVSQTITDFGRTRNLTASARLRAEAVGDNAQAARADIVLQVDRAYFSALSATSVLTVAQQTVNARQLVVDQVTALTNAKLKSGLDLSFAQVNLSQARLALIAAQSDLDASYADLSNALGYRETRTFVLADAPLSASPPTDAAPLIQQSLAQRPEILSARADVQGALKFTEAERDLKRPTVSAVGAAGEAPVHQSEITSRYAAAGVNVSIPIFNGHLFTARANEAEYRAQAAQQNLRALENRIARDVEVAVLNASTAFQRLSVTQELLAQASQSLDLAQARYDLGLGSIVELSQAQLNLTSAQIANAQARFEYALQRAVLDYQSGVTR